MLSSQMVSNLKSSDLKASEFGLKASSLISTTLKASNFNKFDKTTLG